MRRKSFLEEKSPYFFLKVAMAGLIVIASAGLVNSAMAAETIKIGVIQPTSGPIADIGKDIAGGIEVGVAMVNERGGVTIKGQKYLLKTVSYDDQCKPPSAVAAARKLMTLDKVKFIFGPTCSSAARVVLEITEEPKVMVFTSGTAVKITENPYAFRVSVPSAGLVPFYTSHFMRKRGLKNIAFLAQNDDYGRGIVAMYQKEIKKNGGKIAGVEYHQRGATDLYPQLTKLKALDFDALFLGIPGKTAGFAIRQYDWKSKDPRTVAYVKKYKDMFNRKASHLGGAGICDGVLMFARALEAAGTIDNADKIRNALLNIEFKGITSAYGYESTGELKVKPFLMKIQGGKLERVKE
jgi:branched-chain amino acid transport system substrate-binding protein